MKKGAAALIMIFFLALGFAAWGAYSLNDDALSLTITSEPLLGESALGDFPVTERSQLALRVLFTADSAGANSVEWLRESESFYSWEPVLTLGSYSPYYGVTFSTSGSGSSPEELLDAGGETEFYAWDGLDRSVIAYASERAEPVWGEQTLRISLGDFTGGYLPVGAVLNSGDGVDVSEYFPVPLPEGAAADVRITLTPPGPESGYSGSVSYDIEPALGAQYLSAVGGAADAGEWSYFLFYAYEADTDGDFVRRLDGSMLPGGGWGVWRVPCEGEGEERLPDFSRAELVVPMDWGWEGACLGLSGRRRRAAGLHHGGPGALAERLLPRGRARLARAAERRLGILQHRRPRGAHRPGLRGHRFRGRVLRGGEIRRRVARGGGARA